jgi:hypothetical protein
LIELFHSYLHVSLMETNIYIMPPLATACLGNSVARGTARSISRGIMLLWRFHLTRQDNEKGRNRGPCARRIGPPLFM